MSKKYYCPVCGYESDTPIDVCPICGAKARAGKNANLICGACYDNDGSIIRMEKVKK